MKIKKEYLILAVIIVAASLYLIFKNTDKTHYTLPETKEIDKEQVTMLIIARADTALTLRRQDEKWMIQPQGYLADQPTIDRMLDALAGFALTTLVSQSGNYSQYELSDETKIVLEVFEGDASVLKADIGKAAPTYNHTFVKLEDEGDIYQARGNIRSTLDTDIERLRDKSVLMLAKDDVTGLKLSRGDTLLAISRLEIIPEMPDGDIPADTASVAPLPAPGLEQPVQPLWFTSEGEEVDARNLDRVINAMANLRCDGFLYGKTREDLGAPIFTLRIEGVEAAEISIFEKRDDDKYPAVSSQNDFPFLLSKWKAEQLMKKREDLVKKEAGDQAP
jgi:hypothetical protein